MPYNQVMSKFRAGTLHSGSKAGPKVANRKQAIAILMSEKRQAAGGKQEYQAAPASKPSLVGIKKALYK